MRHPPTWPAFDAWARTRLAPDPDTGCVLWLETLDPDGYAVARGPRGTRVRMHRYAVTAWGARAIPKGWHVDHLCRVRRCLALDHLEIVHAAVNLARVRERSRGPPCPHDAQTR